MVRVPLALFVLALLACGPGAAVDGELHVGMRPADVEGRVFLGSVQVKQVGLIKLAARRQGERITIYATAVDGSTLGRAEADPAGTETPISIRTPDGLEMVTIVWASPGG